MRPSLAILGWSLLAATAAHGAEARLQNDTWTGAGPVSSAIVFGSLEGAGALFEGAGADYPLKIIAIEVLGAPASGAGGQGNYVLDVWDEALGNIEPPTNNNGNRHSGAVLLSANTGAFTRVSFAQPLTVNFGKVFVSLRQQQSSAADDTTVALDHGPLVAGANWFYRVGNWSVIDGMGPGPNGVSRNWIIRLVLEVPDPAPVVFAVSPPSASNASAVTLNISGNHFTQSSTVRVGQQQLTVIQRNPPGQLTAVVPAGLAPGSYTVSVTDVTGTGNLVNGFTVTGPPPDAGQPADAGTADGGQPSDAGTTPGTDAGGQTPPDGGEPPAPLRLDAVSPTEAWSEESLTLTLTGDGFAEGARVLVGTRFLRSVTRTGEGELQAVLPEGTEPGEHDVSVLNPDNERVRLRNALTVHEGARPEGGCGCAGGGAALLVWSVGWLAILARRRRTQRTARSGR